MKKNITINLSGRLFNIDEDAYQLLKHYTDTLRRYYGKHEGDTEIADDIDDLYGPDGKHQLFDLEGAEKTEGQILCGGPEHGKQDHIAEAAVFENRRQNGFQGDRRFLFLFLYVSGDHHQTDEIADGEDKPGCGDKQKSAVQIPDFFKMVDHGADAECKRHAGDQGKHFLACGI